MGGVGGGASATAKARRVDENAGIHVSERGPFISFAHCGLPCYLAGETDDRAGLIIMTPERFWTRSRVHAPASHEVFSINRLAETAKVQGPGASTNEVGCDQLILTQGAKPIVPPSLERSCPPVHAARHPERERIAKYMDENRPKRAVVIGGGFIGMEMAEAFHRRGMPVTIVELSPHILPPLDHDMAARLEKQDRGADCDFNTGTAATAPTPDGVAFAGGGKLGADLVLLSTGVKVEVELAKAATSPPACCMGTDLKPPPTFAVVICQRSSAGSGSGLDAEARVRMAITAGGMPRRNELSAAARGHCPAGCSQPFSTTGRMRAVKPS